MRKTRKSKILSLMLCMSMVLSTFAFTSGTAAAEEVKSLNDMTVEEQFEYLKSIECDCIQGFLLGKPIPKDEVEKLLLRS